MMFEFLALTVAGFLAGTVNALAGGGPIITLGAMVALGFDPKVANLTSTVALSPGQILAGRIAHARGEVPRERAGRSIILLCVAGGAIGGALLLQTPSTGFRVAVPWLVLLATGIYAWKAWVPDLRPHTGLSHGAYLVLLSAMAIYGGYFGGGNSFLVLALLAAAGIDARPAGELKNFLIAAINLGAVGVFVVSGAVAWSAAIPLVLGSFAGSWAGAMLYGRLNSGAVRLVVIASGLVLAGWFFIT